MHSKELNLLFSGEGINMRWLTLSLVVICALVCNVHTDGDVDEKGTARMKLSRSKEFHFGDSLGKMSTC